MNKFKVISALLLIISIITVMVPVSAASDIYLPDAEKLKTLGLFKGSDVGFELDRAPNRLEAGVMLVRLLGKEAEALEGTYYHPFDDVPDWADKYIGFMYENGLTNGIDESLYGAGMTVEAKSYATFLLRALGYSDKTGDFTWNNALDYAVKYGLVNPKMKKEIADTIFTRGCMVSVSYTALNTLMKDTEITLGSDLAEAGVFSFEEAVEHGIRLSGDRIYNSLPYLADGEYLPQLVGLDEETVKIKLRNSGVINFSFKYVYDEYSDPGVVLAQNYFPYYIIDNSKKYILTVSRGPSPAYHEELESLCDDKKLPDEIRPYIIAGGKYIISSTALGKSEVLERIRNNINDIKLLSLEDSMDISFLGRYHDHNRLMEISYFGMDESIIIHEMLHALSYDPTSGKSGLSPNGIKYRKALEGYTSYIADRKYFVYNEMDSHYRLGDIEIRTTSDMHFCNGSYDRYLEVYSPLFQIAGDEYIERMYFSNLGAYNEQIKKFNDTYGTGIWDKLMTLGEEAMTHICNITPLQQQMQIGKFTDYYDGILECLDIDYTNAFGEPDKLREYYNKLSTIKGSIPLDFNGYREKLAAMENKAALELAGYGIEVRVASDGMWIVPEFYGLSTGMVFSKVSNIGDYSHGMTYSCGTSDMLKRSVEAIRFREGNAGPYINLQSGDEIPFGGEYILITPKEGSALASTGYYVQRNLMEDFKNVKFDFDNPEEFVVKRILESDGIDVKFEFIEAGERGDYMDGRIIAQYPSAGSAMLPGESEVILTFIKGR